MKTNLNNNSRHFSLNTYNKTEIQFPVLKTEKNEPVYKFYINSNTLSSIINDSVKKNIKINYKTRINIQRIFYGFLKCRISLCS